jgi:hypothetical protein
MKTCLILISISLFLIEAKDGQAQGDWLASKWSLEAAFSPNYSNRILTNTGNEQWHKAERDRTEIGRIGYTTRFIVNYHFHERWHIGLGLSYANIGFATKPVALSWVSTVPNAPQALRTSSQYSYAGINLLVHYKLVQLNRWNCYLTFGATAYTYLDKNVLTSTKINDSWSSEPNWGSEYERHSLFALLGISNTYQLIDGLSFVANLNFSQAVIPSNNQSRTKELLNYLSLDLGLQFRFGRKEK